MDQPIPIAIRPGSDWPAAIPTHVAAHATRPPVTTQLLLANDRVRVWEIRLAPGERIGFHRHVLDYFWTAVTAGTALSHQGGGPHRTGADTRGETPDYPTQARREHT